MPVKLVSSDPTNVTVGVDSVELRATISFTEIQATSEYVKLAAEQHYELANATEIWGDPDSKNKILSNEYPLNDVVALAYIKSPTDYTSFQDESTKQITLAKASEIQDLSDEAIWKFIKSLEDTTGLVDVPAKDFAMGTVVDDTTYTDYQVTAFTKALIDAQVLTDSISKSVDYNRAFTDAFTLDDWNTVHGNEDVWKSYQGLKQNIFGFSDVANLQYAKPFSDFYGVIDTSVINYRKNTVEDVVFTSDVEAELEKPLHDEYDVSDLTSTYLSKAITDSTSIHDVVGKGVVTPKSDSYSIYDDYSKIVDYAPAYVDYTLFGDVAVISTSKSLPVDNVGISDTFLYSTGRIFGWYEGVEYSDERVTPEDAYNSTFTKRISDSINLSDSMGWNFIDESGVTGYQDSLGVSDTHSFIQHKTIDESVGLLDNLSISVYGPRVSSVLGASTLGSFYLNG